MHVLERRIPFGMRPWMRISMMDVMFSPKIGEIVEADESRVVECLRDGDTSSVGGYLFHESKIC